VTRGPMKRLVSKDGLTGPLQILPYFPDPRSGPENMVIFVRGRLVTILAVLG
jgi:hypothetical protein